MRSNDVIALIVILLFLFLAGISFGIYRLVVIARREVSVGTSSGSASHSSAS